MYCHVFKTFLFTAQNEIQKLLALLYVYGQKDKNDQTTFITVHIYVIFIYLSYNIVILF